MEIAIYKHQDKVLVQLSGRVVLDECDRLKAAVLPRITSETGSLNLDLSKVEFIDSAGLGVLVSMKVSANKTRSKLSLLSPSKPVSDILMVSKLDSIFEIVTGGEAAGTISLIAKPENLLSGPSAPAEGSSQGPATFQAPPSQVPTMPTGADLPPKKQIEQLCKKAVEHMKQRDYESAAECYKSALELDPDYISAHNNLAIVYEKRPQWQELAVKEWEVVLKLSQDRGDQKHIERAQKHLAALQGL